MNPHLKALEERVSRLEAIVLPKEEIPDALGITPSMYAAYEAVIQKLLVENPEWTDAEARINFNNVLNREVGSS